MKCNRTITFKNYNLSFLGFCSFLLSKNKNKFSNYKLFMVKGYGYDKRLVQVFYIKDLTMF